MDSTDAQQRFFQHVKNSIPSNLSFVDEVSELLNISNDSAYRRIRGEKSISFEEIRKLCLHYKISLDQLFHLNSESILFTGKLADHQNFGFDLYLQNILQQLELMNLFERRELLVLNKDIPIFHHLNTPELAAFKYFFWMKTILKYPQYSKSRFVMDEFIDPF